MDRAGPELPVRPDARNVDREAVLDEHGRLELVQALPEPEVGGRGGDEEDNLDKDEVTC